MSDLMLFSKRNISCLNVTQTYNRMCREYLFKQVFNKENIIIRELTKTRQRYIWGAEYLPQIDGG